MKTILNKEYPKYNTEHNALKNATLSAITVFLIFALLQPFGLDNVILFKRILLYFGYSLFSFFITVFEYTVIRTIIKRKKKVWNFKDELISKLILIIPFSLIIFSYTCLFIEEMDFIFAEFLRILYFVFCVEIIMVILEYIYFLNKATKVINEQLVRKHQAITEKLNIEIKKKEQSVSLKLEKNTIDISRAKLLYISSISNYLEIYLLGNNNNINKITKRGRLQQSENDLKIFPEFFKCHRAFIINSNYIRKITGNIKNAKIVIGPTMVEIPVSRFQYKKLKELIEKIVTI